MDNFLILLTRIVTRVKEVADALLSIAVPVCGALIASDLIFGTTFNVFARIMGLFSQVGITGNGATILAVVAIVLWWETKKK